MLQTQPINEIYLLNLLRQTKEEHYTQKPYKPIIRTKLTKSDKIRFAYDYYDNMGIISILTVLEQTENKELQRTIIEFMVQNGLLKSYPSYLNEYRRKTSEIIYNDQRAKSLNPQNVRKEYVRDNWLEIIDEDSLFSESKAKHPIYQIFLDKNNNPIKFDKDMTTKVKLAIIDSGLIPARCIVEGAYAYVAKGNLQEYISYVKSLKGGK